MMYLRPKRKHQEDTCALTSPSEAMETSQLSGKVFLFLFITCSKLRTNITKLHNSQYFQTHATFLDLLLTSLRIDFFKFCNVLSLVINKMKLIGMNETQNTKKC